MPRETEFFTRFTSLVSAATDEVDSEYIWRIILALHDAMIVKMMGACRRDNPKLSEREIKKLAQLSLLNWVSSQGHHGQSDGLSLFLILRELLTGDLDICEQVARNWIKECSVSGASNTALKKLSAFSELGEKFLKSDGHNNRAISNKERQSQIFSDLQRILTYQSDTGKAVASGVHKSVAYARLRAKYGLSTRQLQRIAKKFKSDV